MHVCVLSTCFSPKWLHSGFCCQVEPSARILAQLWCPSLSMLTNHTMTHWALRSIAATRCILYAQKFSLLTKSPISHSRLWASGWECHTCPLTTEHDLWKQIKFCLKASHVNKHVPCCKHFVVEKEHEGRALTGWYHLSLSLSLSLSLFVCLAVWLYYCRIYESRNSLKMFFLPKRFRGCEIQKNSEGCNCRFQKTPRTEGLDKVSGSVDSRSWQICLSQSSILRLRIKLSGIFPRIVPLFLGNHPTDHGPPPSQVFWEIHPESWKEFSEDYCRTTLGSECNKSRAFSMSRGGEHRVLQCSDRLIPSLVLHQGWQTARWRCTCRRC